MQHDTSFTIQKELTADEYLLWSGRPGKDLIFQPGDNFRIPLSLAWLGAVVYFFVTTIGRKASMFFLIMWGFFICYLLYFVFGRFLHDIYIRSKTSYGLTSQRILIIIGQNKIKSLDLKSIPEINISERSDKRGTITFGPEAKISIMEDWSGKISRAIPKFEMIDNVRQVYDMVREAQKKLQPTK